MILAKNPNAFRFRQIVEMILCGGEISVGGYVDTVLRQHLEQHKERINELYKTQREDLDVYKRQVEVRKPYHGLKS